MLEPKTDTPQAQQPLLFVYSFSHHMADMDVREKLKLAPDAKQQLEARLREVEGLRSHVVVDTCNRWEVYGVGETLEVSEFVWKSIRDAFDLPEERLKAIVAEFRESQMIQHLFEVSAGVDSQMVGETEILGQVKSAYSNADGLKQVDMTLHRIFSKAFQAAKWVRTHTSIGRGQVSIGNISVELASRIFGDLDACKVLLIGSGEVGRLTAQALKNRNAKSIHFTSRSLVNAQNLAGEIGGEVFPFEKLEQKLHEFDIIVSSTAAPGHILERAPLKKVMRKRSYRPLFMIDLAMPRDIEPSVGKISQVFLYNLDDVSNIANENLESRSNEIEGCKRELSAKAWVTWLEVIRRQKMRKLRGGEVN